MTIPIIYIGNDWITPNIHPVEKLCFFGGTGMKLNIHDDRQKQPQVATGNTTTFQQKTLSLARSVQYPIKFIQHKSSRKPYQTEVQDGPKNYSYSHSYSYGV